jgi:hypothetical protein
LHTLCIHGRLENSGSSLTAGRKLLPLYEKVIAYLAVQNLSALTKDPKSETFDGFKTVMTNAGVDLTV